MTYSARLNQAILEKNSRVCVGLDPRVEWLPAAYRDEAAAAHDDPHQIAAAAILASNRDIIQTISDMVPAVKLQSAFYERHGAPGVDAFHRTVGIAHEHELLVIGDAKRGDIGCTAAAYAEAFLTPTGYDVDALTINPFLGMESMRPFFETALSHDKGLYILLRTSNPGSELMQDADDTTQPLYIRLAEAMAAEMAAQPDLESVLGGVVAATNPIALEQVRTVLPTTQLLLPGVGAQGGDVAALEAAFTEDRTGALISSSRGIVFSKRDADGVDRAEFLRLIEDKTQELTATVNQAHSANQ